MPLDRRKFVIGGLTAPFLPSSLSAMASHDRHVTVSISIEGDRIWAAVSLTGSKPELFILDTGAVNSVISTGLVEKLGLQGRGYTYARGLGGIERSNILHVRNVSIGGAFNIEYMEFRASRSLDRGNIAGLFGTGIVTEFDTDLDFAKGEWRIYPKGRNDRSGYSEVPGSFRMVGPTYSLNMDCHADDFSGRFLIDSGAPCTMLLDGNASASSGLWSSDQPYVPMRSRGFGEGSLPTRLYRLKRIKLHKYVFENPLVLLSQPGAKNGQFRKVDGLIGLRALRHFHISTDAKNKSLWLAPNGLIFPDDDQYPMSGIWLKRTADQVFIDDIGTGSPAAAAGLRVDDEIVDMEWDRLVHQINGNEGQRVVLDYLREGERARAEFTLSKYL